ncbi:MAG: hypothetical protein E5W65_24380 [Mesorhizobium sp.]|uniref:hypothetical protein n=1 Tax=Mesorhizobium sp. TaxID=1871066 RepID=UPI00122A1F9B|nr:hypothetical protein [Mesorhizobium sp.]TIT32631.1 MAG: hypothetical protein E5W65_24380 [Mesorhizobium sp.]
MTVEREMTLKEWVETLPSIHRARKEYEALIATPASAVPAAGDEALRKSYLETMRVLDKIAHTGQTQEPDHFKYRNMARGEAAAEWHRIRRLLDNPQADAAHIHQREAEWLPIPDATMRGYLKDYVSIYPTNAACAAALGISRAYLCDMLKGRHIIADKVLTAMGWRKGTCYRRLPAAPSNAAKEG